ncbi:MAG: 23S rRNA (guanosine(2251)-2'-O)-methyltransferase RlmB [Candidatus Omnitrophota bacterium]|nr:MAG: 23S rRNA (guanosine(2251)-2'-O)-methyltransferase RlmB [Candidatus Omnitrophota bacterium]
MYLSGKNQVIERINAQPETIEKIYLNKGKHFSLLNIILAMAKKNDVECVLLSPKEFSRLSSNIHTQGVIAEVKDFSYTKLEEVLNLAEQKKYALIALSNLTDPQNLGSILRSCACFGRIALIIPKHRSVVVNSTVLKVACGGENYVPVIQVTNLIPAFSEIKECGYWIGGCVANEGNDITQFKLPWPLCLVIGAEGRGIRKGIIRHLDFNLTLPMPGKGISLNAAVACAIFCYEIMRQRKVYKK